MNPKINLDLFKFHYFITSGEHFENKKPLTVNEIHLFKNYGELVLLFQTHSFSYEVLVRVNGIKLIVSISSFKDYDALYLNDEKIMVEIVKQYLDSLLLQSKKQNEEQEQEYFYC